MTPHSPGSRKAALREWHDFLLAESHVLQRNPALLFQQAINQPDVTDPAQKAQRYFKFGSEKRPWLRRMNKQQRLSPQIGVLIGHSASVEACAWSPDGRRIVSCAWQWGTRAEVKVWNVYTGKEEAACIATKDGSVTLSYSSNGEKVILRFTDGSCSEWDSELGIVAPCRSTCLLGSFSPDMKRIVVGSRNGTIEIKDAAAGTTLLTLTGPNNVDPQEYPDVLAREIRASGMGSTLGGLPNSVVKCLFSPDGALVVSATQDETLQLWDAAIGTKKAVLVGHADVLTDVVFSPDAKKIASSSIDKTVKLWNTEDGALLSTYVGHSGSVKACAFSPDGRFIISASADKTLRIWDAEQMRAGESFCGGMRGVTACDFSPDGKQIVTGNPSGELTLCDAETGEKLATKQLIRKDWKEVGKNIIMKLIFQREKWASIIHASHSPDGSRILTVAHEEASMTLYDAATLEQVLIIGPGGRDWVRWCAFSPDGRMLASGHSSGVLNLWDAGSGALLLSLAEYSDTLVFSSNGKQILPDSERKTGIPLALFEGRRSSENSPDGVRSISGLKDDTLNILETGTTLPVAQYIVGRPVQCVAWHPGGQKFVLGDAGGQIHILNLENITAFPIMVTAWMAQEGMSLGACCPVCRKWSEIEQETLGKEKCCLNCGKRLRLNPFAINADWRPIAKAWRKSNNEDKE